MIVIAAEGSGLQNNARVLKQFNNPGSCSTLYPDRILLPMNVNDFWPSA